MGGNRWAHNNAVTLKDFNVHQPGEIVHNFHGKWRERKNVNNFSGENILGKQ